MLEGMRWRRFQGNCQHPSSNLAEPVLGLAGGKTRGRGHLLPQAEKGSRAHPTFIQALKNRRQLASDAGHLGFGIVAPDFSQGKTEVGSIRRRPVGGGLGVYEPVPDRTVSGNTRKFVGHWGISADKRRQNCGEASPIPTGVL
ncbi:hypothetical protein BQ8482_20171 [Mesorhizobium delmotii]|uniref:Uncharacterized protein n=1 Tax=Mesorhizobium delmotii TaxID=1631247 RepID=A0A2P9AK82_9HYPH|nr:hypothetical protein BQ8482_20171 [Mesorhizobium delmotii]